MPGKRGTQPQTAWEADGSPEVNVHSVLSPVPAQRPARDVIDVLSDAPPRSTPPPVRLSPELVQQQLEELIRGARDLLVLDNHSGAMEFIEKALELSPEDPVVQQLKAKSEVFLQAMYESKLGRLDARPQVCMRPDEIIWLKLDHRAGFVLAQIDGGVTFEDLISICGMSRMDTLRILAELVAVGVIAPKRG